MILQRDVKVMKFVRRLAVDNPGVKNRFKLAAAITYKRDIVCVGTNHMRTHPMQKLYGKNNESIYFHAEINCISNALNHLSRDELKKSTLYIHRVKRKSSYSLTWVDGSACPCEGCQSAIVAFDIGRVIFSTDKDEEYKEVY
jgi:tRNA(Arg) A34 adenosine deaminase TadA